MKPEKLEGAAILDHLIGEYGGQIYNLGLRFCGNATDAEDLVQETLLNAYKGWDQFEGRSQEKTWLYTIASRVCQRMQRKRAGEPQHMASLQELMPFDEPLLAVIPSDEDDAVQETMRREAQEQVEAAIATLPEDFRVPLILKELVGFSVPQVAAILGLEEGTVKSRVHRARLKLRAAVDAVLPRQPNEVGPPAYSEQMCLDLLNAKQEALDKGLPFDEEIICDRCSAVFASLDLTHEVCQRLAEGELPEDLRERLRDRILSAGR